MDPLRFDSLTRSAANRRDLLTRLGAGGLAAAMLAAFGRRPAVAAQVSCSLDLRAYVRLGPSAGMPLTAAATQAGNIEGTLHLTTDGAGGLTDATFVLADGSSWPVAGQAIGNQLGVRIALDEARFLVLQGIAEQPLSICQGSIDGSLIGPAEGDLGDWHGSAAGPQAVIETDSSAAISAPPAAATGVSAPNPPTSTPLMPTPSPTAECTPLGAADVCPLGSCGPYDDGCGGFVECPGCVASERCAFGMCCRPKTASEYCAPDQCDLWSEPCGDTVDCGGCDGGLVCQAGVCCSPPGTACFVGGECCSGSCSMLNGCN